MQNLPAYLQGKSSNRGLAQTLVANLGAGSPPFLSIMGNRLTLIDAAGEEIAVSTYDPKTGPYLDCVVIDALERTSKIFYDKAFDPSANQYEPPACFSDNGIAPSRNAGKPQARTCAECQWAAWGSKTSTVSGKAVKACQDVQKIAILVPGYEMPFLLRVPPNSRTNFRGYVNKFIGQPMDIADVMTRISFEPGVIGTLHFSAVGWLDEKAVLPQRDKLIAAKATDSMVGRTDLPREGGLPAPVTAVNVLESGGSAGAAIYPAGDTITVNPGSQATAFVTGLPAQQPTQMAPAPQQPTQQRRRRNTAAAPAPAAQEAPFMAQPAQANGPASNFGIQQAAEPARDIQNTLNSLFGS